MRLLRPLSRVPLSGSPSSPLSARREPRLHWLRRSGIGLLALFLAGSASFAAAPVAPEIGIEQSAGTALDKTVVAWGVNDQGQTTVPGGLTDVRAIAAGAVHSVALKADGSVVAWGTNIPAGLTGVVTIAAGGTDTLALVNPVVAFGDQIAGTSVTKTFTIKNTGSAVLNITGVNVYGDIVDDFTVTRDGMLENIPATTGTTTFTVTFHPTHSGARTKTLGDE